MNVERHQTRRQMVKAMEWALQEVVYGHVGRVYDAWELRLYVGLSTATPKDAYFTLLCYE